MRVVTYFSELDRAEHVGFVDGDDLYGSQSATDLLGLLREGGDALARAEASARSAPFETVPLARAVLRAPLPVPPSIRDFMSFEDHVVTSIAAMGGTVSPVWYQQPVFYFTNPAAVRGPFDDIPVAPGSTRFDYELEVAAVIGTAGSDIAPEDGEAYIAGYTILGDWSARDLQATEMEVGLGPAKGKDTATTLGPVLVTPDELEPFRSDQGGYHLTMTADVNGRRYSEGSWSSIYWNFGQMVAYASRGTRLLPGDVIGSGTVGTGCILELSRVHGSQAFPWLVPGDEVRLAVEQLGVQRATIVAGSAVVPLGPPTPSVH